MRKLYNEFLHVSKDEKITDKVIVTRMTLTVILIIACLFAMGISAYAYFGHGVASSSVIQSGNFETLLSIKNLDTDLSVDISDVNSVTKSATLEAGKYVVTIEKLGSASTGFCVISAENGGNVQYYTQQLGKDVSAQDGKTYSITFTIEVTETTTVRFTSTWGTSPYYADYVESGTDNALYVRNGEEIKIQISGGNQ